MIGHQKTPYKISLFVDDNRPLPDDRDGQMRLVKRIAYEDFHACYRVQIRIVNRGN